jgi:hypothetical protein
MDIDALQADLHDALDRIIDQYRAAANEQALNGQTPKPTADRPVIQKGKDVSPWTYTWWAGGGQEEFQPAWEYELIIPGRTHHIILGRGTREAWGRDDRKRVIVFWQAGSTTSDNYYPWTEFVETDDGRYAAPIPNPDYPRKILTESEPLPPRFRDSQVERLDALFEQVAKGPSLRLVVDADDEEAMIRHGYWVATLRGRF